MYKQLADWNKKVDGLEILLFPSDEFGGQELPAAEIAPFLQGFKLTKDLPLDGTGGCRLMEKVTVNGDDPRNRRRWKHVRRLPPWRRRDSGGSAGG